MKKKQYREENKEIVASRNKQWRENNKEHNSLQQKQWRDNNKEYLKRYIEENKDKIILRSKRWREENKLDTFSVWINQSTAERKTDSVKYINDKLNTHWRVKT